jgi:WD40 repeat protein
MKTPNLTTETEIAEQPILELTATTQLSDYVSAIAWSPTGNTLAAACCNGEVHLIRSFVGMMLCPPTGCRLAAGGRRGELFVWSVCE